MGAGRAGEVPTIRRTTLHAVFLNGVGIVLRLLWQPSVWRILWHIRVPLRLGARFDTVFNTSWSQDGEDILLEELFSEPGFFVDVGAHHPLRFSVTQNLTSHGWTGINIDANPAMLNLFPSARKGQTNFYGLAGPEANLDFYRFKESALSTTDKQVALDRVAAGWELQSTERLMVTPLKQILSQCDAPGQIDLLSVDAEGSDLSVLHSMDWQKYRVRYILVEVGTPAWQISDTDIGRFLAGLGYLPHAVFFRSALFAKATPS